MNHISILLQSVRFCIGSDINATLRSSCLHVGTSLLHLCIHFLELCLCVSLSQGLRASSLQFTSPLEFNAIFRDGFPLRLDLNGWSKICDPVTAKFKRVTVIVLVRYYVVMTSRTCRRCEISKKLTWNLTLTAKKCTTFSFPIHGALASYICLRDAPICSCIQLYT